MPMASNNSTPWRVVSGKARFVRRLSFTATSTATWFDLPLLFHTSLNAL